MLAQSSWVLGAGASLESVGQRKSAACLGYGELVLIAKGPMFSQKSSGRIIRLPIRIPPRIAQTPRGVKGRPTKGILCRLRRHEHHL
jgi:hypothetical protein